jgi:hypothetical protein
VVTSLPIRQQANVESLKDRSFEAEAARLREARPLREFERIVNRMGRSFEPTKLIVERPGKAFREAWIAAEFGRAIGATHLQLADDNAPDDFYLKRKDQEWLPFQITEAMLEGHGRERAQEFRERPPQHGDVHHVEHDEIKRASEGALPAILARLESKALSTRGGRLVIYWNTGWLIGVQRFIEALRTETEPYRDVFAEAWIIGKRSVFRIAPDFEMVQGPPAGFA